MGNNLSCLLLVFASICLTRRLKEQGYDFDIMEQSDVVGGTWVYDERTGKDEHGLSIHTSMYRNLWTNLPKEVMGYPDHPINDKLGRSYVSAEVILDYLKDCANKFGIMEQIKFKTHVQKVKRVEDVWIVSSKDLTTGIISENSYDAVMVCNGHYHTPNVPSIPGIETFSGIALHSHDYRTPEAFLGLRCLVIGAGPSGLDIARDIVKYAPKVYLSHHSKDHIAAVYPQNFQFKPDLVKIRNNSVYFIDGSKAEVDILIYCTGFLYNFPFLDESCGVTVNDNFISPLYKHIIAINNPTMCFIGLPYYVCANSMFDLQVQFFLTSLEGSFKLPTVEDMLEDEQKEIEKRRLLGLERREFHKMGELQGEYYDELSSIAKIRKLPTYMAKLHCESSRRFMEDIINFRNDKFTIIDDDNFECVTYV